MDAFRVKSVKNKGFGSILERAKLQPSFSREERHDRPLGPYPQQVAVTEGDIRKIYSADWSCDELDKVILVIQLGLSMCAFGRTSLHIERSMQHCAMAMDVPLDMVRAHDQEMTVQFHRGPLHVLPCVCGKSFCKGSDVVTLCDCITLGGCRQALKMLEMLDEIADSDPPCGWLLSKVSVHLFAGLMPMVAFNGDIVDFGVTLLLSIVLELVGIVAPLCIKHWGRIMGIITPALIGILTPLISVKILDRDQCHCPAIYLGAILMQLPDMALIDGAYEVLHGVPIDGACRLINATVTLMYSALALFGGWHFFGDVDENYGRVLVPIEFCDPPFEWWIQKGVLGFVVSLALSFILHLSVRNIPFVSFLVSTSLMLEAFLSMRLPNISSFLINVIVSFFAAFCSYSYMHATGITVFSPLTTIFILLAPGSTVFRHTLNALAHHSVVGVTSGDALFDVLMEGISYSIGIHVAEEIWIHTIHAGQRKVAAALSIDPHDTSEVLEEEFGNFTAQYTSVLEVPCQKANAVKFRSKVIQRNSGSELQLRRARTLF